jgi:hypothetical protein
MITIIQRLISGKYGINPLGFIMNVGNRHACSLQAMFLILLALFLAPGALSAKEFGVGVVIC